MRQPRGRRFHNDLREEALFATGGLAQHHRHHLLDRRACPAAFSESAAATEHEQAAPPLGHEVGDHLKLVVSEE